MADREGYRRICTELLKGAGQTPPVGIAYSVARVCTLGPDALGDYTRVLDLVEQALSRASRQENRPLLNILGALHYRAGQYRKAIGRLQEGITAANGAGYYHDWLFLAMAHQRLGETARARPFLARVMQQKLPEQGQAWVNLEVELLRLEAETLLRDSSTDPKP
jgi:tetratricopeptide (TPR) repeat protein